MSTTEPIIGTGRGSDITDERRGALGRLDLHYLTPGAAMPNLDAVVIDLDPTQKADARLLKVIAEGLPGRTVWDATSVILNVPAHLAVAEIPVPTRQHLLAILLAETPALGGVRVNANGVAHAQRSGEPWAGMLEVPGCGGTTRHVCWSCATPVERASLFPPMPSGHTLCSACGDLVLEGPRTDEPEVCLLCDLTLIGTTV